MPVSSCSDPSLKNLRTFFLSCVRLWSEGPSSSSSESYTSAFPLHQSQIYSTDVILLHTYTEEDDIMTQKSIFKPNKINNDEKLIKPQHNKILAWVFI